jgi:hypothetical protein
MARRHGWLWLAMLALLAAQMLGVLHRSVHLPFAGKEAVLAHAGHGVGDLFASHGDHSPDCRLYDQLGHGDAMAGVPLLAVSFVVPAYVLHATLGQALARWAALFDARGPPAVR